MTRKSVNTNVFKVGRKLVNAKKLIPAPSSVSPTTKEALVKSSNIYKIGYDAKTKTLTIEFNSRRKYVYYNVSAMRYKFLSEAPSKGEYFNKFIRYTYKYKEI